jgi:hypothetical protein
MTNEVESAEAIAMRNKIERDRQMERQAQSAHDLRTSGAFITFKNANLKADGKPVQDNQMMVRLLAAIPERAWYDGPYDADNTQVPACYALDSVEPHPEAADPQAEKCMDCPKNKWGTAPPRPGSNVPGKGKACQERARIIVVPAGEALKTAALYTARIPVMSLSVTEDKKSFFKVHLEIREHTPDMDPTLLLAKQDEAYQLAMQPYPNIAE